MKRCATFRIIYGNRAKRQIRIIGSPFSAHSSFSVHRVSNASVEAGVGK
jgi:hypothetical protein